MSNLALLSDREKAALRLLSAGHDAKSAATVLGISVHTLNDRLRDARRKLGVSSSRAAARILSEAEAETPENLAHIEFGIGEDARKTPVTALLDRRAPGITRLVSYTAGASIMIFLTTVLAANWLLASNVTPKAATADRLPQVIATYPTPGAVIPAGPFTLSVTYDQPMRARSFSFVQASRENYPVCDNQPAQSLDGRSFTMRCTADSGRAYEIWFNWAPYLNFRAASGGSATPYQLRFRAAAR